MQLTMREQEKMMISLAAMIAQRRKDKGIKLNHPEAVALKVQEKVKRLLN